MGYIISPTPEELYHIWGMKFADLVKISPALPGIYPITPEVMDKFPRIYSEKERETLRERTKLSI